MKYTVYPTGANMFDACHTYGLAVLLAHVTQAAVEIKQEATHYAVTPQDIKDTPTLTNDHINDVLTIPDPTTLADPALPLNNPSISVANLDGLLAASFTRPGARICSVWDARNRQKHSDEQACTQACQKVGTVVSNLLSYAQRYEHRIDGGLSTLLAQYAGDREHVPILTVKGQADLTLPMTIDPAAGYSTRQPLSNGHVAENVNLTIQNLRLAILCAFIGATRFLRAQRCDNQLVLFVLPKPQHMIIRATTCLPVLTGAPLPVGHQLTIRYLELATSHMLDTTTWQALTYSTLQTQGAQQSIPYEAGDLDYDWLTGLLNHTGTSTTNFWIKTLQQPYDVRPYDAEYLIDSILHRSGSAWLQHLRQFAEILAYQIDCRSRPYTASEIQEITDMLPTEHNLPLRTVLSREQGTMRFGHALRQLGQYNPSALRDVVDDLETATDLDQLLRVLAVMVQLCVVLKAKSPFIIIPTDGDLAILLADAEQFGPRRIASVLLILAVLHYPRDENELESEVLPDKNEQTTHN